MWDNYFVAWQFNFREFNVAEDMYAQVRFAKSPSFHHRIGGRL